MPRDMPKRTRRPTMKRALLSDSDAGSDSDYEVQKPSPAKRAKTKSPSKSVKGKGKSSVKASGGAFQHLPVEIVLEITSYLPPEPLVSLMFLCRFFYDILSDSSPASLKMWKRARSNETIPVPRPPLDFTELQWARFLYEKHCQLCGPGPQKKLTRFFSLRKRVCAKCISAKFVILPRCTFHFNDLLAGSLISARAHIVLKKIPFASTAVLPLVMLSDKDSHGNELVEVFPDTYDNDGIETMEIHREYHWIPHIVAMMRELSEDYEEVFFGTQGTVPRSEQQSFDGYVEHRKEIIEAQLKHAYKCIVWEKRMDRHPNY